jgi:hypothetical protein
MGAQQQMGAARSMTIVAAGIDRASARAMAARSSDTSDAKPSSRARSAHVPALPMLPVSRGAAP